MIKKIEINSRPIRQDLEMPRLERVIEVLHENRASDNDRGP
jgi:hypothetical protein